MFIARSSNRNIQRVRKFEIQRYLILPAVDRMHSRVTVSIWKIFMRKHFINIGKHYIKVFRNIV